MIVGLNGRPITQKSNTGTVRALYSELSSGINRAVEGISSSNTSGKERRESFKALYEDAFIQQAVDDAVRDSLSNWRKITDKELLGADSYFGLKDLFIRTGIESRIHGEAMLIPVIVGINGNRIPLTTGLSKLAETPKNYKIAKVIRIEQFESSGTLEKDVLSDNYGLPKSYSANGNIHPSRCVIIKANNAGTSFIKSFLSYYCHFIDRNNETTRAVKEANFLAFGTDLGMLIDKANARVESHGGDPETMVFELLAARNQSLRQSANNTGAWAYDKQHEEVKQVAKTNIGDMVSAGDQAAKLFSAAVNQTNARFLGVGTSNMSGDGGDGNNQNQTLIGLRSFMFDPALSQLDKIFQIFNPKIKKLDYEWNEIAIAK